MSVIKVPIVVRFDYNSVVGFAEFTEEFLESHKDLDWICSLGYKVTPTGKDIMCLGVVAKGDYEEYLKSTKSV